MFLGFLWGGDKTEKMREMNGFDVMGRKTTHVDAPHLRRQRIGNGLLS
jgi:hypothetical protein